MGLSCRLPIREVFDTISLLNVGHLRANLHFTININVTYSHPDIYKHSQKRKNIFSFVSYSVFLYIEAEEISIWGPQMAEFCNFLNLAGNCFFYLQISRQSWLIISDHAPPSQGQKIHQFVRNFSNLKAVHTYSKYCGIESSFLLWYSYERTDWDKKRRNPITCQIRLRWLKTSNRWKLTCKISEVIKSSERNW